MTLTTQAPERTAPATADPAADASSPVTPVVPGSSPRRPDGIASDRRSIARGHLGRRVSVVVLLLVTAGLYLWDLSASGWANSFYSAAVQAGSESWKAFLFGSLDAGNAITVDKPPASLWLMALSVRIFGLSSWSILVPQALLGVATVGVVYGGVRRTAGHAAGLLAGVVLALTPVAALMFRFNNPDAMLIFLLSVAAYAMLRATEVASRKWIALAGVLIGFAFLTKMMQAFLVLPAFVIIYAIAAPAPVRKRIVDLLVAFGAMIVSLGWWVAIVELTPASLRPYVGGSENNSILDLVFGYNGLQRILGGAGNGGTGGGGSSFGSIVGITRIFDGVSGGMVAWLIPAALFLAVAALITIGRAPRTDKIRAGLGIWLGWLVVTLLVFSFMEGTYHDYYTVALSPAIAGTVAIAATVLWRQRHRGFARIALAVAMAGTSAWGIVLIFRATQPYTAVAVIIGIAGALATVGLLLVDRLPKALAGLVVGLALVGALAGPTSYTLQTVTTAHQGSIVTAGPAVTGTSGGLGGGPGGGFGGRGGTPPTQQGTPAGQGTGTNSGTQAGPSTGSGNGTATGGGTGNGTATGGGMGGGTADATLVTQLQSSGSSYTWAAATTGSQTAATYQLASGQAVMAIGGFNGGDNAPTLAQFQELVSQGKIHYYIASGQNGGGGGPGGSNGSSSQIASWVAENYTATTIGSATVYDLTASN